jgi:hypothetical protein
VPPFSFGLDDLALRAGNDDVEESGQRVDVLASVWRMSVGIIYDF